MNRPPLSFGPWQRGGGRGLTWGRGGGEAGLRGEGPAFAEVGAGLHLHRKGGAGCRGCRGRCGQAPQPRLTQEPQCS